MIRRLTLLLPMLGLLALPSAASAARINVAVGVGDQSPRMFEDANWRALGLKKTRYFIEWNAIDQPVVLTDADRYVAAARRAGVKVLMHISTDDINSRPRRPLPSVSQYKSKVGALIRRYRSQGVTEWGAWNEANHSSQPTQRNPKRAAQFYKTMRGLCRRCTIVALDVLDQSGVERYIASWMKAAGSAGRSARVFGIHNYSQVNRRITGRRASNRYPGTARIVKAVRKKNRRAKFWYTETGGVVNFGRAFPCSTSRQANRTKFMFQMAKTYDRDIERLYSYNWFGNACNGFDAGLVEADGTPRPAYAVFRSGLRSARK